MKFLVLLLLAIPSFAQVSVNATLTDGTGANLQVEPSRGNPRQRPDIMRQRPIDRYGTAQTTFGIKSVQPNGTISIVAESTIASTPGYPN